MSTRVYQESPIERLMVASQVRKEFDEADIQRMAASIQSVGLLQPILTRPVDNKLLILDGERRYRAALHAGLKMVPVLIDEAEHSPAETIERQLIANIQRKDLRPTERATGIEKLIELCGTTASAVAERLGLSSGTVTRLLAILKLPQAIRCQVDAGKIPMSAGYDLAKISDPEEQSLLASRLATGQATRDGVSGAMKARRRNSASELAKQGGQRVVVPLGDGKSVSFVGGVSSLEALIGLCEELLAKARKARTQGWTVPTFLKVARDSQR